LNPLFGLTTSLAEVKRQFTTEQELGGEVFEGPRGGPEGSRRATKKEGQQKEREIVP